MFTDWVQRMYKLISTIAVLSLSSTAASASTIDAFDLNTSSAAGTNSIAVLTLGQVYNLTVFGTFRVGSNNTRHIADAEYFNLGSSPFEPLDRTASLELGVGVDGIDIDFGAYSASNTYTSQIVGKGKNINVFFADSNYTDNVGNLKVELSNYDEPENAPSISPVPLPAGLPLLLGGLGGLWFVRRRKA